MESQHNIQLQKPADLIYGLYDKPKLISLTFLALQQILLLVPYLVLVIVITKKAHLTPMLASNMISWTLISMAIGTMLQALAKGPIGSGYLAAACPMPNYLMPSIVAVQIGGLPLMAGMVIFSGFIQLVVGWVINRLRFMFPNVLVGIVFSLIGLCMSKEAFQMIITNQSSFTTPLFMREVICFATTFCLIAVFNVWGKGVFRLLCSVIGLLIGTLIAFFLGLINTTSFSPLKQISWLALPQITSFHYSFNFSIAFIFIICSVASVLRAMGAITTAQMINDAHWRRPDNANLRRGLLADGITPMIAGLLSTTGLGCTPSSVGMSKACGATSRIIAYAMSLLAFIIAFCPKVSAILLILPNSVMAAGLLFVSCILFTAGLRIMAAQTIDARKTFVICLSLFLGLSTDYFPQFYQQFPNYLLPIVSSPVSLGTVIAFITNLIFRFGITRTEQIEFDKIDGTFIHKLQKIFKQLDIKADHAEHMVSSFSKIAHLIIVGRHNEDVVTTTFSYDELNFIIILEYRGSIVQLPAKKNFAADDLDEENAFIEGINMLYKDFLPDKTECSSKDGKVVIRMIFAI